MRGLTVFIGKYSIILLGLLLMGFYDYSRYSKMYSLHCTYIFMVITSLIVLFRSRPRVGGETNQQRNGKY